MEMPSMPSMPSLPSVPSLASITDAMPSLSEIKAAVPIPEIKLPEKLAKAEPHTKKALLAGTILGIAVIGITIALIVTRKRRKALLEQRDPKTEEDS